MIDTLCTRHVGHWDTQPFYLLESWWKFLVNMTCCGGRRNKWEYRLHSTSYQVQGILQETSWENFTIRAEGSIVKAIFFFNFWRLVFLFFSFAVVLCACVICCVECRHSISHGGLVASWYVLRSIFYNIVLYAPLLYLIPGCWRLYVVPVVSNGVCVLHIN